MKLMRLSTAAFILGTIGALMGCAQTVKVTGTGTAPPLPGLSLSTTSLSFGNVTVNTSSTQSITMTSTGNAPVTVSSIAVSGSFLSIVPPTLPLTLQPQATSSVAVTFTPTAVGADAGSVTIFSNAYTSPVQSVALSGNVVAGQFQVNLTWQAPASSPDPVASYDVWRAASGSSIYQQINTAVVLGTSFSDPTVTSGNYNYYVTSVDANGVLSAPSNVVTVSVP